MNNGEILFPNFLNLICRLIMVEFCLVVWMFDDDFSAIDYPYFNVKPFLKKKTAHMLIVMLM